MCRLAAPVGGIKNYGFAARNSSARPKWWEYAEKHALFQCYQESVVGEPVPGLGRENGLVHRIGHATNHRFASRNPSAHAVFERASFSNAVALESRRLRGRPVRAKSRPKEWLGSPDRAHQDLSTRVEKPPCARRFPAGELRITALAAHHRCWGAVPGAVSPPGDKFAPDLNCHGHRHVHPDLEHLAWF